MRTAYSQEQLTKTKHVIHIIGDSNNILILYELMNFGEKSFNELKRMTDMNAVTLSKKLSHLKDEGFVANKVCGKENHYFLTKKSEMLAPIIKDIEKIAIQA